MLPLVSTRISLAWPPEKPFEDTDTLVIQGRTGFFLDLRVFKKGPRIGDIDWASAGVKSFLPDSTEDNPKASFEAIIDSRRDIHCSDDVLLADEGSFTTLSNGDVLETGSMRNPNAEGEVHPYEEVWRRLSIEQESVEVVILASTDGKAFLGRVGSWEIGLSEDVKFLATRRDWVEGLGWGEVYCVGGDEARERLPPLPKRMDGGIGTVVNLGGRTWVVKENSPEPKA